METKTCRTCRQLFETKTFPHGFIDECDPCSNMFYNDYRPLGLSDVEGLGIAIIKDSAAKNKLKFQIKQESKTAKSMADNPTCPYSN